MRQYLNGDIAFKDFEERYHQIDQADHYITGGDITDIKNQITGDIRITYDEPDPNDPFELSEDELRESLTENLQKLEKIVANYRTKHS